MHIGYDKASDVVYMAIQSIPSRADEEKEPGVLWRYAIDSGELVGVTILDFSNYWAGERLPELVEVISKRLSLPVDKIRQFLSIKEK